MSHCRRPGVAVAGCSAARVGLAAGGQDEILSDPSLLRADDHKVTVRAVDGGDRSFHDHFRAAAGQSSQQCLLDIQSLVTDRKDFSSRFDLGLNPFGVKQLDHGWRVQTRQCRMEKFSAGPVRGHDPFDVRRLRDVATGPARHQDLHGRLAILLHQQRFAALLCRACCSQQTGGACSDDNHVMHESLAVCLKCHAELSSFRDCSQRDGIRRLTVARITK